MCLRNVGSLFVSISISVDMRTPIRDRYDSTYFHALRGSITIHRFLHGANVDDDQLTKLQAPLASLVVISSLRAIDQLAHQWTNPVSCLSFFKFSYAEFYVQNCGENIPSGLDISNFMISSAHRPTDYDNSFSLLMTVS